MSETNLADLNERLQPDWVRQTNAESSALDIEAVIPLDEASLLNAASAATGLDDFGECSSLQLGGANSSWREPFRVYLDALESEAELTLVGRLMARNDIVLWLKTRLQLCELLKKHPEIREQAVTAPMFVVGLPRSGTSILFELLAQDQAVGVPLIWEALMPCPPPEHTSYHSDARIAQADRIVTQWNRVCPAFATMHEMRGDIPAECGLLMAPTFISDHNASLQQTPSYSAWCAEHADYRQVYEFHKLMLQVLQWRNPRQRWLLKAPEHQVHLETLLDVYPDARIVQTHRDPIKCMASTGSLMEALYLMRSDQAFNAEIFDNIILGEATAGRLERVMDLRDSGVVSEANIVDSRYQDLMDDPLAAIARIYHHFAMDLDPATQRAMQDYLRDKPQGKFGAHRYEVDPKRASERRFFARYQQRYAVPDEV